MKSETVPVRIKRDNWIKGSNEIRKSIGKKEKLSHDSIYKAGLDSKGKRNG